MAYIPSSGSTVAFQSDPTKLVGTMSVTGTLSVLGTVPVTQATTSNPWIVQLTSGSVITSGGTTGNSSVQVVGTIPPTSVSGVGTFNIDPVGAGSIIAKLTNSSVTALQGTNPWIVNVPSPSTIAYQLAGSVVAANVGGAFTAGDSAAPNAWQFGIGTQGYATAIPYVFNGTNYDRLRGNSSVGAFVTTGASSVIIQGSVTAYQAAGSVMAVSGNFVTGNSSVMLTSGTNTIGSVAALQSTNPWIVQLTSGSVITSGGNSSVQVVGLMPSQSVSGVGNFNVVPVGSILGTYQEKAAVTASAIGIPILFKIDETNSVLSAVSPQSPFPIRGSVAALQGTNPWVIGNSSVMLTPGVNVIGSVAALQGTNPWVIGNSSVMLTTGTNVIGSVAALQGTQPWLTQIVSSVAVTQTGNGSIVTVWKDSSVLAGLISTNASVLVFLQAPSIVGTYAEDVASGGGDKGLFTLGIRNDTVASTVNADLDYVGFAADSAGRQLTKPFAADENRLDTTSSTVSTSVAALFNSVIGLRLYVTDVMVANTGSVATLITFKDGSTSVLGYTIAPAGGGSNINGMQFPMRTAPGQDFTYVPATATSVLYVTAKGYKAP